MTIDMATLNTRIGYASNYNSSLGWFYDNTKPAYRTRGLENMAGYYYYASNISGTGWTTYNCSGYIAIATTYGSDGAILGNCNCNCTSNCGTKNQGQCVAGPITNYDFPQGSTWSGANCTECYSYTPAVCSQCSISGNCDSRTWMQPNCNCMQCNCGSNCGQCSECSAAQSACWMGNPWVVNGNCQVQCSDCNCTAGTCFLAGTLVLMADGSHKAIEDVVVGDALARGSVLALWRPLLGPRSVFKINGIVTTGDHTFKTELGWTAVEPQLYRALRYGEQVEVDGKTYNLGSVEKVGLVFDARFLELHTGEREEIGEVLVKRMPPITQLYGLFTDSGEFVIDGGYIVDGVPQ